MRSAALVSLAVLAGCAGAVPGPDAEPAPDPLATLPAGVTRDMVYTRRPDPRAGPCSYYRVEGLEVLLSCAS